MELQSTTETKHGNKAVLGLAADASMADRIVTSLKSAGFRNDDISALFPDKQGTRDFAHETNTKAPEGAVAGASVGGVVGGTLGLLAGIGALAIPGIGPLIAAGPIMAALSGLAAGAALGGLSGGLIGLGVPEVEAKQYEAKVKDGNILISVGCGSSATAGNHRDIDHLIRRRCRLKTGSGSGISA